MLGRLARWLRLLGFDTLYYPDITDSRLLLTSLQEDRVILTRDTGFSKRKNIRNMILIRSENPLIQVREVVAVFGSKRLGQTRCARCNGALITVESKDSVSGHVPEYVYMHYNNFWVCGDCGNVYWEGTHVRRFKTLMKGVAQVNEIR